MMAFEAFELRPFLEQNTAWIEILDIRRLLFFLIFLKINRPHTTLKCALKMKSVSRPIHGQKR